VAVIVKNREVKADVDRVWEALVDWKNETRYWTNVREIRVLKSDEASIEREATVGPRGFAQKTRQTVVLEPKKSINLTFRGESISGERNILLIPSANGSTRIDVAWSLDINGLPGFVEGIVKNQISKVTQEALARIAKVSEDGRAQP